MNHDNNSMIFAQNGSASSVLDLETYRLTAPRNALHFDRKMTSSMSLVVDSDGTVSGAGEFLPETRPKREATLCMKRTWFSVKFSFHDSECSTTKVPWPS